MRGPLLVLGGALCFSLGGVGIKLCGFGPWQVAAFRSAFAVLALLVFLPEARRNWSWKILPVAAAMAGTFILYVWGNKSTTAANTIFIQSSAPLWVLLLSPVLLREPIRLRDVASMVVFGAGLGLFFLVPEEATVLSPAIERGNWMALAAGFFFALVIIGLRALRGRGAEASVVLGNALAFVIAGTVMLAAAEGTPAGFAAGTAREWGIVLLIGFVQIALAYAFYTRGLRVLSAVQASLIGLVEAVLNPLWVFLVFRTEQPGPWALLGGAIILSATAYQVLARERAARISTRRRRPR